MSFSPSQRRRLADFMGRSRIVVLASHSAALIRSICNKAALLQGERYFRWGSIEEILDQYSFLIHGTSSKPSIAPMVTDPGRKAPPIYSENTIRDVGLKDRLRRTNGAIRITSVFVKDVEQRTRWSFASGEPATIYIEYEVIAPVADLALLVRLYLSRTELEGQIQVISDIWADISH